MSVSRSLRKALALILCASLVKLPVARASIGCPQVLAPADVLREALGLDGISRTDRRIDKRLSKIDFDQGFSRDDIARLVKSLSDRKFGSPIALKQLVPGFQVTPAEHMKRLVIEETAREGLIRIYSQRGELNDINRLRTSIANLRESDTVKLIGSFLSLATIRTAVPIFQLPEFALIKPSDGELATLVAYGEDSMEGQEILGKWLPKIGESRRQALFIRAFNKLSVVIGVALILWIIKKKDDAAALANGKKITDAMSAQVDELDARTQKLITDTPDDLMYDVIVEKLKARQGTVSQQDYADLCASVAAPHRCH